MSEEFRRETAGVHRCAGRDLCLSIDDNTPAVVRAPAGVGRCDVPAGDGRDVLATRALADSRHAVAIFLLGSAATAELTAAARQIDQQTLPAPPHVVAVDRAGSDPAQRRGRGRRPWLSAPKEVIGNLVFTQGGVYAEFLVAGQPGGMMPFALKKIRSRGATAADPTAATSGAGAVGVSAPLSPRRTIRAMLDSYTDRDQWVDEVREWDSFLQIEPFTCEQIFGLRIPVDAGMVGRSGVGGVAKAATVILGRDPDDPQSLAGYRTLVEDILGKIRRVRRRPAGAPNPLALRPPLEPGGVPGADSRTMRAARNG